MFENGFFFFYSQPSVQLSLGGCSFHVLNWFSWGFRMPENLKSTEPGKKRKKTQKTVDRHRLQQSMCEIYETDWGFTVLNQVCMLALCSYINDCFSNIKSFFINHSNDIFIKEQHCIWHKMLGLSTIWRNASWNVLRQVLWERWEGWSTCGGWAAGMSQGGDEFFPLEKDGAGLHGCSSLLPWQQQSNKPLPRLGNWNPLNPDCDFMCDIFKIR